MRYGLPARRVGRLPELRRVAQSPPRGFTGLVLAVAVEASVQPASP